MYNSSYIYLSMRLFFLILLFLPTFCVAQKTHQKWRHVYDANRLQLITDSISVVGVVHKLTDEIDGDIHIQLRLDSYYSKLLNKRNYLTQDSCLVIELICVNESVFKKCNNYNNDVWLPEIGDLIEVTGAYVFDKRHRWMEIHPVYNIKLLSHISP